MWVLRLNDMRAPQIEIMTFVCRAERREDLEALLQRELTTPYTTDDRWNKVYRQGGPLEWFNPPWQDESAIVDVGTREQVVELAARNADAWYVDNILSLPECPS